MICPLSPSHFVALGAFQLFAVLLFFNVNLAPLPLIVFVVICCISPLFPRFSFFLPIVSRGERRTNGVALTFDDGPDPEVTPQLLELLARQGVTATFFVTGERAERYPEIVRAILSGGHAVGNHSYSHSPFLMLKGPAVLGREVASAQAVFRQFGIVPLAFRPPVGITNSRLWRVLLENGMFCVNFSLRGCDMGNRRVGNLAQRLLAKVRPRDIVLLHDVAPRQGDVAQLLNEFSTLIDGLKQRGVEILPLARLIGKEVMQSGPSESGPNAAELFYNGLAESYDEEQFTSAVSLSRSTELRLFAARCPELFAGAGRVLEIGAGTGIFTMEIARNCSEVVAADISGNMLALLEKKARAAGLDNIIVLKGNVESMELQGPFSVVCAFSALEYLADLPAFFRRLAREVEPGGAVYFITARSSLFRFFTQIGNAVRQGLWLKAHSRREIEAMLTAAGFEQIAVCSHLLKSLISGGMLLEVVARKGAAPAAGTAPAASAAPAQG
ncbi:MAG: polysaccharide deacetylase [Geobacteraceae bacterium GWC2_58_44]|nr:MAG: polysaccharide deacetylase [Geobacteraceae bacterium GWC2_58_44]HBG06986.1 polysaccharide deacetylase [Geobacter sp.]